MKNRTGEIVNGIKIIRYRKYSDIDIMFDDGTILSNVEYGNLKKGSIKNPFCPRIYNIGFIGIGNFNYKDNLTAYRTWEGMIRRCYDKNNQKDFPSYIGCSVAKEWHNFQNFAKWFYDNYIDGYQLDKDLMSYNNKIYSPDKCCFLPQDLNKIFTHIKKTKSKTLVGVYPVKNKFATSLNKNGTRVFLGYYYSENEAFLIYKKAKEDYIKEQANKYKESISDIVYFNLINYEVKPYKT